MERIFLRHQRAALDFVDGQLHLGDENFPLICSSIVRLPTRTKQLVQIPIERTKLVEGYIYIRWLDYAVGILAGESLVKNEDGTIRIYSVNSIEHDIEFTVPPSELEEFEKNLFEKNLQNCLKFLI